MELIKGMTIIFICLILGELISSFFPVPLPGNIIGMIILFASLISNLIKLENVNKAGNLLLDNLILFFIPIGVGIIRYKELIINEISSIIIVGAVGFLLLFIITAKSIDLFVQKRKAGTEDDSGNYQ